MMLLLFAAAAVVVEEEDPTIACMEGLLGSAYAVGSANRFNVYSVHYVDAGIIGHFFANVPVSCVDNDEGST